MKSPFKRIGDLEKQIARLQEIINTIEKKVDLEYGDYEGDFVPWWEKAKRKMPVNKAIVSLLEHFNLDFEHIPPITDELFKVIELPKKDK